MPNSGNQRGLQNDRGQGERSRQDENDDEHRGGHRKPSTGMVGQGIAFDSEPPSGSHTPFVNTTKKPTCGQTRVRRDVWKNGWT